MLIQISIGIGIVFAILIVFFAVFPIVHFIEGFRCPLNGCKIWLVVYNEPQNQMMENLSLAIAEELGDKGARVNIGLKDNPIPANLIDVLVKVRVPDHKNELLKGSVQMFDYRKLNHRMFAEFPFRIAHTHPEHGLSFVIYHILIKAWGIRRLFIFPIRIKFSYPPPLLQEVSVSD